MHAPRGGMLRRHPGCHLAPQGSPAHHPAVRSIRSDTGRDDYRGGGGRRKNLPVLHARGCPRGRSRTCWRLTAPSRRSRTTMARRPGFSGGTSSSPARCCLAGPRPGYPGENGRSPGCRGFPLRRGASGRALARTAAVTGVRGLFRPPQPPANPCPRPSPARPMPPAKPKRAGRRDRRGPWGRHDAPMHPPRGGDGAGAHRAPEREAVVEGRHLAIQRMFDRFHAAGARREFERQVGRDVPAPIGGVEEHGRPAGTGSASDAAAHSGDVRRPSAARHAASSSAQRQRKRTPPWRSAAGHQAVASGSSPSTGPGPGPTVSTPRMSSTAQARA